MSGIEVAGIILGAIPLVISGLEHYSQSANAIKSMWRYPKEFQTLSRRLRIEYEMFRNTMELILSSCVRGRSLEQMLTDSGGKSWEDADVERELHRILQGSHTVFVETVLSMSEAISTFRKRLRLSSDGKVRISSRRFQNGDPAADRICRDRLTILNHSGKHTNVSTLH
jgi:hypothetical protein